MKIARLIFPCGAKAQRKLIDSLAVAYGVKRKFLEHRMDYNMRVWAIAEKAIARDMHVDVVNIIADPYSAPMSVSVYADENGKRSQLFPPLE